MQRLVICLAAGLATAAGAQTNPRFTISSSNTVTLFTPSTTLTIHAAWDQPAPGAFVFSKTRFDLSAPSGRLTESNIGFPGQPGHGYGTSLVRDATVGQLHIPSIGIHGSTDNPIELAKFTWTTSDFTPRYVDVSLSADHFSVVSFDGGSPLNLEEAFGSGFIRVDRARLPPIPFPDPIIPTPIPAPGSAALLALGVLTCARRRRAS